MIYLKQDIDTSTDSFSYTPLGAASPLYEVVADGKLYRLGKRIGHFTLGENHQWLLYLGDELYMSNEPNRLFGLPEFELKALTELANSTARPALAAEPKE